MPTDPDCELAITADRLYESGNDAEILALAQANWPTSIDDPLPEGVAEVCRFARLAYARKLDVVGFDDASAATYQAQRDLWEAHGLTAALLAGDQHVIAGFLLPRFFSVMRAGAFTEARTILDDMVRLIDESANHQPFARVLRRLTHEKRGFSYFVEGRYQEAVLSYEQALEYTTPDSRGNLKARGGRALARYMGSARTADDLTDLNEDLVTIRTTAEARAYPDVVGWSVANLRLVEGGQLDRWEPFELL